MTPRRDQPSDAPALTEANRLQGYLEMWKQTVTVQQHFNEICWKIRGLALTALTFTLGAASLTATAKERPAALTVGDLDVDRSALTVCVGLLVWLAFFFVDASWYHRLLKASVDHGTALEQEVKRYLPQAGLTAAISAGSPSRVLWTRRQMRSTHKLRAFYWVIAGLLLALAVILQLSG
ncbi:hypothetical protein [Actinotalea sp. C106]|uniref:hypothetical protein n=1 Tax=Actinotalea sp. C106 TaxID=2908644 RepID=UPI002028DAAD|nr:hypothetical protein [Actinotalea sp. C106]